MIEMVSDVYVDTTIDAVSGIDVKVLTDVNVSVFVAFVMTALYFVIPTR